jgi:4-hydroxy-tetrahydrodipicolinate synthase
LDEERETLLRLSLDHVAGRVPVVVTTSHFSTDICAARSKRAQEAGAAMVMVLPPYHGATLRVGEPGILEFYRAVSDAVSIPVMVQDAPIAGTTLTASFLAQMARDIENLLYFKIETPQAAAKLREIIRLAKDAIEGPWDGEEGITLLPDLDAGATGCMSGGGYPDGLRAIIDAHAAGNREDAAALYEKWLPLINYENRQCGLETPKILMKEGGVIKSDRLRRPLRGVTPQTREGLLNVARPLDPLVLRWSK